MASAGTAYLDVQPDVSPFGGALDSLLGPITSKFEGKFGKFGKAATVGFAGAAVAAVGVGKALYDVGEQFDSAYDKIQTGTGATGKRLDGLKDDFRDVVKSVPTDFDSAADAVSQLNQRLGISGRPLRTMSKQMLELSRITDTDLTTNIQAATRTFGDWGIKVKQQPAFLDKMFRASQATGISVADLGESMVRYGAPLRQMGFGFEEAAAMVGKFEKEGVNAQLVMGSLRIALGKMATEGVEDPSQALGVLTDRIKNAGTAGEANKLALETFGARAGPDMAAAIREGRFEFGDLVKTIDSGKSTIIGTGEQTQDFAEKWLMFKNRVLVAIEPIATRVFNAIGNAMGWLATTDFSKVISDIRGFIRESEVLRTVFGFIGPVVQRILPGIQQTFSGIAQVVKGAVQIIAGILTLDFGKAIQGVKTIFGGLKEALIGALRVITAPVREVASRIGSAVFTPIKNFVSSIPGSIANFLGNAKDKISGMVGGFASAAKSIGQRVVSAIVDFVKGLPGKVSDWFWKVVNKIHEFEVKAYNAAKGVASDMVHGLVDFLGGLPSWVKDKVDAFVSSIVGWIKDKLGIHSPSRVMQDVGEQMATGLIGGIDSGDYLGIVNKNLGGMANLATELLKKAPGQLGIEVRVADAMLDLGANFLSGNGSIPWSLSKWKALFSDAFDWVHAAKKGLKKTIKSRWLADGGRNLGPGMYGVGDAGPELMRITPGGRVDVFSNPERLALQGAGGGARITHEWHAINPVDVEDPDSFLEQANFRIMAEGIA